MKKVICFGAGGGAIHLYNEVIKKYDVVAFADNATSKHGKTLFDKKIIAPEEMGNFDFEGIVITSVSGQESITSQILKMGYSESQIIPPSFIIGSIDGRIEFLRSLATLHSHMHIDNASVAEAGVFEGEFAQYINSAYPNQKLHLFDTFEGFSEKDIEKETGLSTAMAGEFSHTSEKIVMKKMTYPENVIIHKGFFPETAIGNDEVEKELFCYVNLDMDLYQPTLEGLRFFAPKMVKNGIITVHDYFWGLYENGIKKAIEEFMKETKFTNLRVMPIGDGLSIGIVGF